MEDVLLRLVLFLLSHNQSIRNYVAWWCNRYGLCVGEWMAIYFPRNACLGYLKHSKLLVFFAPQKKLQVFSLNSSLSIFSSLLTFCQKYLGDIFIAHFKFSCCSWKRRQKLFSFFLSGSSLYVMRIATKKREWNYFFLPTQSCQSFLLLYNLFFVIFNRSWKVLLLKSHHESDKNVMKWIF